MATKKRHIHQNRRDVKGRKIFPGPLLKRVNPEKQPTGRKKKTNLKGTALVTIGKEFRVREKRDINISMRSGGERSGECAGGHSPGLQGKENLTLRKNTQKM